MSKEFRKDLFRGNIKKNLLTPKERKRIKIISFIPFVYKNKGKL
jgi:hypothetical protein